MTRTAATSMTLLVLFTSIAAGADLKSGLQPGDLATPFEVKDVTGPNKGVLLCYR